MRLSKFKEVVSRLHELECKREEYINGCPQDIQDFLRASNYISYVGLQFDTLIQALFGKVLVEEVYWFLFEWHPNTGDYLELDGKDYTINTLDDFFSYIELAYGLVD